MGLGGSWFWSSWVNPAKFQHARLFVDLDEARFDETLRFHLKKLRQPRRIATIDAKGAPGFEAGDHLVHGQIARAVVHLYGLAPASAARPRGSKGFEGEIVEALMHPRRPRFDIVAPHHGTSSSFQRYFSIQSKTSEAEKTFISEGFNDANCFASVL